MSFVGQSPFSFPNVSVAVNVDATSTLGSGGTKDWWGRASIKRRSDGVLVMVYYRATGHSANDGALHIRFSDDDGATWSTEDETLASVAVTGFPMNPSTVSAGEDAGEPWLYVAPSGDLVLHMWRVNYGSDHGTYQSRSTDGGNTWTTSAAVTFGGVSDQNDTFSTDDDFIVDGVIYAGARTYTDATQVSCTMSLITSTDDGATWSKVSTIASPSDVSGGLIEVGLVYVGSDTIIAFLRDNAHTHGYQRTSTDMGATWGTFTDVTSTMGIAARVRANTRAFLRGQANWWLDPVLILEGFVQQTPGSSQDRRNCVWVSRDRGVTISAPFYVDSTAVDAGYGDIFYDAGNDQYVVVSYEGSLTAASLKQYRLSIDGV